MDFQTLRNYLLLIACPPHGVREQALFHLDSLLVI